MKYVSGVFDYVFQSPSPNEVTRLSPATASEDDAFDSAEAELLTRYLTSAKGSAAAEEPVSATLAPRERRVPSAGAVSDAELGNGRTQPGGSAEEPEASEEQTVLETPPQPESVPETDQSKEGWGFLWQFRFFIRNKSIKHGFSCSRPAVVLGIDLMSGLSL